MSAPTRIDSADLVELRRAFELGRAYAERHDKLPLRSVRLLYLGSLVAADSFASGFCAAKIEMGFFNLIDWHGEGHGPDSEEWWR